LEVLSAPSAGHLRLELSLVRLLVDDLELLDLPLPTGADPVHRIERRRLRLMLEVVDEYLERSSGSAS